VLDTGCFVHVQTTPLLEDKVPIKSALVTAKVQSSLAAEIQKVDEAEGICTPEWFPAAFFRLGEPTL
jgi:hypothetical protein